MSVTTLTPSLHAGVAPEPLVRQSDESLAVR